MQRGADAFVLRSEKAIIQDALTNDFRLDGRTPYDHRKVKFQFSLDDRSATVLLGQPGSQTRVMTTITAALEAPYPDRGNEGSFRFNVDFSPMASPAFEGGRPGDVAVEISRILERGLKQSGALDPEALCVLAGRHVWSLRVDVLVLDHCGNLADACFLSALAALMAYRKPDVTVSANGQVVVHPPEVREPSKLTIHHTPLAITFALFEGGSLLVMDPVLSEEASSAGSLTVIINPRQEVCGMQKARGCGVTLAQTMRCVRLAATRASELIKELTDALQAHEVVRVQARVRRHRETVSSSELPTTSPLVLSLASDQGHSAAALKAVVSEQMGALIAKDLLNKMDVDDDDDDDDDDSSSSDEDEDEDGGDEVMKEVGGAKGSRADEWEKVEEGGRKAAVVKTGAVIKPGLLPKSSPAKAGTGQASPAKVMKRDVGKWDEMQAIADIIAGAGPGKEEEVKDLRQAIKTKPNKKAKFNK